jgi:hypothetical protein
MARMGENRSMQAKTAMKPVEIDKFYYFMKMDFGCKGLLAKIGIKMENHAALSS